MLKKEMQFEFRKRMHEVHPKNIRDSSISPENNEFVIRDGACIVIDKDADEVILTAARDFVDYLFTAQNISVRLMKGAPSDGDIYIGTKEEFYLDLGNCASYKGFAAEVSDRICICGFDSRGAAQGLYFLEDEMTERRAPFIKKKTTRRKPLFSPRMLHSGFGIDEFPDSHLNAIAHAGRDAILVFVKDVNITTKGYLDFNDVIRRAAKYGIDVYAYSYLKDLTHPDDPGADAVFENSYGRLFKNCPGLRGVTLVGESVRFASRDPRVRDLRIDPTVGQKNSTVPDPRPDPGWWPCNDYPKWLAKVRDAARKYNPDADIVFWTYNWGRQPKDVRLELIEALPTDISLLVTFEMCEQIKRDGISKFCSDYTISFEGPGQYFLSEAEVAAKRGIRLYSMTNTGGLTWDVGTVPYLPMPYQWMRRYEKMIEAHDKYGLCGIMESHHYGFYPSFIGDISNVMLSHTERSFDENLEFVLSKHFGRKNVEKLKAALMFWSDAMRDFTSSNDDQYGPFRVGPAFPLIFNRRVPLIPSAPYAHFGRGITTMYYSDRGYNNTTQESPFEQRLPVELSWTERAVSLMEKGLEIMETCEMNENLEYLINLGKYIRNTLITTANTKKWHLEKLRLTPDVDKALVDEIFANLEKILADEYRNAEETIPLVEADSRLGWEPSMEYIGHADNIRWKLSQLRYTRDVDMDRMKKRFANIDI